ncbi:MAG: histone deacetylase [Hyphomicrobiaceae bacterium]
MFYFPDTPDLPLPPGHRFPAGKYRMLREEAEREALFAGIGLQASPEVTLDELALAHDADYIGDVLNGRLSAEAVRRIGVPWSPILVQRSLVTVGGALRAARDALRDGISGQLAGGTHHAHRSFGSGFCVFNDLAVASLALLREGAVSRVSILDCDVHQGDGTAAILADEPRAQTISMHGAGNFPFRKAASDIDIALVDGTGDRDYLAQLDQALSAIAAFAPDLVLYLAGADALAADRLGRLALSAQGLAARDTVVLDFCRARRLPVSIAIGGGYAEPISITVEAYMETFRTARRIYRF